jgi:hypothetical protein
MLDVVCFVLMGFPIVTGLFFVMHSLKEQSRVAVVPRMTSDSTSPEATRDHLSVSQAAKRA